MLPYRHQVDFARRKGGIPYPCYYCMHFLNPPFINMEPDKGFVIDFGTEGGVPCTCMAGLTHPTEKDDCKAIQILELPQNYSRCYPSSLFSRLTREYYMEMLTDIRHSQPVPRSTLVARANKGYHTREQRIIELQGEGLITQSYNIDGEEMYSLTALGEMIAELVSKFLDSYLQIREEGEVMESYACNKVFTWIKENPNCTARVIYDSFSDEKLIENILETLCAVGYVDPLFDADYSEIRYNVTQKGIDSWKKVKEKQYSVQDAEEHSK